MKKIIVFIVLMSFIPTVNAETINDKITELNNNVDNLHTKLNSLSKENMLDQTYPIGSIYITTDSTSPSETIGGTWEVYAQGRKLVGVGNNGVSTYNLNDVESDNQEILNRTLNASNMPEHNHTVSSSAKIENKFKITADTSSAGGHNHTIGFGYASEEARGYGVCQGSYLDRVIVSQGASYLSTTGNHTHSATFTGTIEGDITGDTAATSSVGNATPFSVQNPYITVYMWKRIG